jgi:hypothetical protein
MVEVEIVVCFFFQIENERMFFSKPQNTRLPFPLPRRVVILTHFEVLRCVFFSLGGRGVWLNVDSIPGSRPVSSRSKQQQAK